MRERAGLDVGAAAGPQQSTPAPTSLEALSAAVGNAGMQSTFGIARRKGADRHRQVDDRHGIVDPYTDPDRWAASVTEGRVADLFRTAGGLDGHVQAVRNEVQRLISANNRAKLEGKTGAEVTRYATALNSVRRALVNAAGGAGFDFRKFGVTFAPLGSDLYLERRGGRLYVDGRAQ